MKFHIPQRYDMTLAEEGVWFSIYDENNTHWGDFRLGYLDPSSPRTELVYKRIRAKYAAQIRSNKLADLEAIKVVFVEAILKDWRGIKDDKGKEVEFSIENALAYFSEEGTRYVLSRLGELSGDVTNFTALEQTVDEIEKN